MTANVEDDLVELLDRYAEGDREATGPVIEQLRMQSSWTGPPTDLKEAILTRVRAEAAPPVAEAVPPPAEEVPPVAEVVLPVADVVPPVADVVPPASVAPARETALSWWRARWVRLTWAIPAVAVAAAAFTFAVLGVDRALQPDPPRAEIYTATGTALAPAATAEVAITPAGAGVIVALTIEGLPAAAPGSYYTAWLSGPRGDVPIGSFHQRRAGEEIRLWSGVDPRAYPRLVVTLQAEGDPPSPSASVVLTGALTR